VCRTFSFAESLKSLTKRGIRFWSFKQRLAKRSQVETGAANEYRHLAAGFDLVYHTAGIRGPFGSRVIHPRVDIIDQVMRNAAAFFD
jgi:hypothetical protein